MEFSRLILWAAGPMAIGGVTCLPRFEITGRVRSVYQESPRRATII